MWAALGLDSLPAGVALFSMKRRPDVSRGWLVLGFRFLLALGGGRIAGKTFWERNHLSRTNAKHRLRNHRFPYEFRGRSVENGVCHISALYNLRPRRAFGLDRAMTVISACRPTARAVNLVLIDHNRSYPSGWRSGTPSTGLASAPCRPRLWRQPPANTAPVSVAVPPAHPKRSAWSNYAGADRDRGAPPRPHSPGHL